MEESRIEGICPEQHAETIIQPTNASINIINRRRLMIRSRKRWSVKNSTVEIKKIIRAELRARGSERPDASANTKQITNINLLSALKRAASFPKNYLFPFNTSVSVSIILPTSIGFAMCPSMPASFAA